MICSRSWEFPASAEPYDFLLWPFSDGRGCSLIQLTLSNCSLGTEPANLSGFSSLRFLSLSRVSMADAVVLNIMSSCCALHSLTLRDCDQLTHATISCTIADLGV